MTISSFDEWSPLKRIIVGDSTHANWPVNDPVFGLESEKTLWKETPVPSGPVPDWIIDHANRDLDKLASVLTSFGVEVLRPGQLNFQVHDGMYNYCPRDRLIVHGDTIIDPAMMYPCRDMELQCYHDMLAEAAHYHTMPRDQGMILDAANVCRLGPKNMLFLESSSGNRKAYDWLCSVFPDVNIELCNFYAGVHIDSTIVPLREGTVLVNGARVTKDTMPKVFKDWEIISIDQVNEQQFYQYPYASKWIALNMLSIDGKNIIMDAKQPRLMDTLCSKGFEPIPLELTQSRTLGGGFHCVTLDLNRG
jgi:glycine amidinotransferase/scyllo-inosamine-4-phosphate amidinotransferase 1